MSDIIETARSAGVHPLAMSEEYLPGLLRFAAVFQQEHAAHIYRLREEIMQQENEMYRLRQQRDELLEALKWLDKWMSDKTIPECAWKVRAAIKAAEEGK